MDRITHIRHLVKSITKITKERDDALKRAQELEKENNELKKALAYFDNSDTPPSARKFPVKKMDKSNSMKKRGAPKGHRGATRPRLIPDEIKEVINNQCEKCASWNLEDLGVSNNKW